MFNSLFNTLFGKNKENSSDCIDENSSPSENNQSSGPLENLDSNVTAILLDEDLDWLFVEKESEECNSIEKASNNLQLVPFKSILSHLDSISEHDENTFWSANLPAIYPNTMDDSWFLTPPECFSSVSAIQLESSPLENLLIEHPSMSVYQNFRRAALNSITNGETINDLVVVELSRNENENGQFGKVPTKNRDKKNIKKSRSNSGPKNVALVLVNKVNNNQKPDQRKTSVSKSAFERNNKCYALRHAPKRTTTINQPSSRTMVIANRKN